MDKQEEPEEIVHMGRIQPGSKMGRMAHNNNPGEYESF
jgi:hypothetical protein